MRRLLLSIALVTALAWAGCRLSPTAPAPPAAAPARAPAAQPSVPQHILLDFETPDVPVVWQPAATAASAPATEPATTPSPQRSSLRPHAGLWSLALPEVAGEGGQLRYAPAQPLDLAAFDVLTAQVCHAATPERNGEARSLLRLTDAAGHTVDGEAYPVLSTWQAVPLDLKEAQAQDLDLTRIAAISLVILPDPQKPPLTIKTDTWAAAAEARTYQGSSLGPAKSFFVERLGTRLHVGSVGQYELVIADQGVVPASVPWLQVFTAPPAPPNEAPSAAPLPQVLGQPHTGLFLLDQDALALAPPRNTTPDDAPIPATLAPRADNPGAPDAAGNWAWPASLGHTSTLQWQVVWTAPGAAIIEGRQEAGGYDRLGVPLLTVNWRLMIYQWGQVYVHVRWTQTGESAAPQGVAKPVSWALMLPPRPRSASGADADAAQRLLADIYTAPFRQGLQTALPHRMQTDAPVAMIAPAGPRKDNFWWAGDPARRIFGTGILPAPPDPLLPNSGQATCMLLVNSPNALAMAGAFGQYLDPPKIIATQGELDRTYPGNWDNNPYAFVETYGFQVVRLANGRATFAIYPQERPIFYPPILFTVPAAEREALDVKHSKLLINIDGKQFANPPQFPDGSFLLQVPYVLNRPVNVEAVLVK